MVGCKTQILLQGNQQAILSTLLNIFPITHILCAVTTVINRRETRPKILWITGNKKKKEDDATDKAKEGRFLHNARQGNITGYYLNCFIPWAMLYQTA